jgi:hypothetical protein
MATNLISFCRTWHLAAGGFMAKQPTPVRIKAEFLKQLRAYTVVSGVPVSFCINEAVGNWIATRLLDDALLTK